MRNLRHRLVLVVLLLAMAVPLLAVADPPDDGWQANRQHLERLRADPEQFARLRHDWLIFRRLPPERQDALRQLERDLQEETPFSRARLERTLERYTDWLNLLPEAERQLIANAPDKKTRLQHIRDLREKQWQAQLPQAVQDKLRAVPDKDRPDLLKKLRQEDLQRRADWLVTSRHWEPLMRHLPLPTRFELLPEGTRDYFEKEVRPLLTKEAEAQLSEAEGKWPRFPRMVVDLADAHPASLLGPIGPTQIKELPPLVQNWLQRDFFAKQHRERLREAEGKWLAFGVALRDLAQSKTPLRKEIQAQLPKLPARSNHFPPPVQQFIEKKLIPALDPDEKTRLNEALNDWPKYPKTVLDLARTHNLTVPALRPLPGRPEFWDRYRTRPQAPLESTTGRRPDFMMGP